MSTKSGPYEVELWDGGDKVTWSYQHDMMGDNFQGAVFYVWGPLIYFEVPILQGQPFSGWKRLSGIPRAVIDWLDRWPETPETKP